MDNNKHIILISGKAGSGKDTVGKILVNNHYYTRYAYADALKDYVSETFKLDRKLFDTQEGKMSEIIIDGKKTSPRQLLIDVSLEKKKENELIWIETVIKNIINCNNKFIVITDFRFLQEYTELIKIFGNVTTLKIERKYSLNIDDPSETSLNSFDFAFTLENNSSKEELQSKIAMLQF